MAIGACVGLGDVARQHKGHHTKWGDNTQRLIHLNSLARPSTPTSSSTEPKASAEETVTGEEIPASPRTSLLFILSPFSGKGEPPYRMAERRRCYDMVESGIQRIRAMSQITVSPLIWRPGFPAVGGAVAESRSTGLGIVRAQEMT